MMVTMVHAPHVPIVGHPAEAPHVTPHLRRGEVRGGGEGDGGQGLGGGEEGS
jgi:hypothetical protein